MSPACEEDCVELVSYGGLAVRLVNSVNPSRPSSDELVDVAGLKTLLEPHTAWVAGVEPADLAPLRALRDELRTVFVHVSAGDQPAAVAALNSLLEASAIRPQISDHDGEGWHLHVAEGAASVSTAYTAAAVMGLAVQFTDVGPDRFGLCQAPPCQNAFVDTSTNRSRRYCSDRCATRANVAAYRARRRASGQ
jgi:predicted RNA-binding Zn ribbon-like protein